MVIGGRFRTVNGVGRWHTARLWGGSLLSLSSTVVSNQLQLTINTQPGVGYTLQASTNLVDWNAVTNFVPTNLVFQVSEALTNQYRFYRVLKQ